MEKHEINKLIGIRNQMLGLYATLEGKNEPTAVVKQTDLAVDLEGMIRKIDDLLRNYVNFS